MNEQQFWLVWNPESNRPPTRQHLSAESAGDEADRLAAYAPGQSFYVLHAVEVHRTAHAPVEAIVLTKPDEPDDEIPF